MKKFVVSAGLALALSACASTVRERPEPIIKTVEVKVPVVQPCEALDAVGPSPSYPDTDQALKSAPSLFERVKLLMAGRVLRIKREATLDEAVAACQ